jgi:N-methylhydantoinase B
MQVDFEGTGGSVQRGINVPMCYTRAMVLYTIKCLTVPELPNTGGMSAPIAVTAPEGCLLNAVHPSATGARHMIGHYVSPLVLGALVEAAPEQVMADTGMMNLLTVQGQHREGHAVSTIYFAAGGFGAMAGLDGHQTLPAPSNMAVVPVEVWETLTSTTVESKRLLADSGGPGQWRGGPGQEVIIRNDSTHPMTVLCMANRTVYPAQGTLGGRPGRLREHRLNGEVVDPRGRHRLAPGDRLTLLEAGGGGYGDPARRDPEALARDVANGLVTARGARAYGLTSGEDAGEDD